MEKLFDEVPSLDLADFLSGDPQKKQKFVADLGEAYQNIGFVAIKNHGLTDAMTEKLYGTIQEFFALNDSIKTKYELAELQHVITTDAVYELHGMGLISDSMTEATLCSMDNCW